LVGAHCRVGVLQKVENSQNTQVISFSGGIFLGSIAEMRRGEGTVMRVKKSGAAALLAATGVAAGIMAAPIAVADTCDPAVAVCQGGDIQPSNSSSPDYSPPVTATDDQYPYDGDWYFNPAGGGTALQPAHPSTGGGGSSGGGGGHR
jgi:hypothetical protein